MKELSKAMAEAFQDIEGAVRDKTNPHLKYKYADLGNVIAAIKPALKSRGLWFVQNIHSIAGFASVETIIMHSSGESLSCGVVSIPVPPKNDPQSYGSALTYARRYSLSAAFGVAPEDDDAQKATDEVRKSQTLEVKKSAIRAAKSIESDTETNAELTQEQIVELAKKIQRILMEDSELDAVVYEKDMVDYLTFWQTKCPLNLQSIEHYLDVDRSKILSAFAAWKSKQPA